MSELIQLTVSNLPSIIKVIGVGGGGGNAVSQMYREGIDGVRFLVANTDSKALEDAIVPEKLQMGPGLGAGGRPALGQQYAEESVEKVREALDDETKMVFITAGMGGGTGTGASPVIAREAMKKGILTVGVVTLPFLFERERQIDKALDGLEALSQEVDAVPGHNNQRLCDIYTSLDIITGFRKADEVLTMAVRSIVEIITSHGKVGLDFRDVSNVLTRGGVAVMSTGHGEGEGRMTKAIEDALYSPLINNSDIYSAKKIVLAISTSSTEGNTLMMEEMNEVNNFMAKFGSDIETKWGLIVDDSLGCKVKVTILASGFSLNGRRRQAQEERATACDNPAQTERKAERRGEFYQELNSSRSGKHPTLRRRPKIFLYTPDDLDNDRLIEEVEAVPTARRTIEQLSALCAMSQATHKEESATAATAGHDYAEGIITFYEN